MMQDTRKAYNTLAICLRSYAFGEADRMVHLFSPEYGRIKAVAKGVKKEKSKLSGVTEAFSVTTVHLNRGKNMDVISQYQTEESFPHIRTDLLTMGFANFFLELIDLHAAEDDTDSHPVFEILIRAMTMLNELERDSSSGLEGAKLQQLLSISSWFQQSLLNISGYLPNLELSLLDDSMIVQEQPYYAFSADLGGIVHPEQKQELVSREWVNVATPTLMYLNECFILGGNAPVNQYENETLLKSQRFLLYYWQYRLEKPLKSSTFVFQLLDSELSG